MKTYIEQNRDRFFEELFSLLRIPSISAKPEYKPEMYRCAGRLKELLLEAGAEVAEVCETTGNPVVYAARTVPGAQKTVLVYGHYDVQPPEPLEKWRTRPFDPVVARDPVTGEEARKANFSNEGGAERRFRFLKNIMGMWLFQSVRRDTGNRYSYDGMMRMAMESGYTGIIDVNHPSLSAPGNMIEAVRRLAGEKELSLADTLSCLYHSLAAMYAECAETVGRLTGKTPERILITGGGSRDRYLNALTARYTGKKVLVGLGEATAAGNVAAQIMKDKNLSLDEVRERIRSSFDIKEAEDVFLRKRGL